MLPVSRVSMTPADEHTYRVKMARVKVAKHYCKKWLIIDAIAAVPYAWITYEPAMLLQLIKVCMT